MSSEYRTKPNQNQYALIEYIYGIIDSKIQYCKFKLKDAIKSSKTQGHYPHLGASQRPVLNTRHTEVLSTDILDKIEETSKIINRLLILRVHLNTINSKLIFELLSSNAYLDYSSEDLRKNLNNNEI